MNGFILMKINANFHLAFAIGSFVANEIKLKWIFRSSYDWSDDEKPYSLIDLLLVTHVVMFLLQMIEKVLV